MKFATPPSETARETPPQVTDYVREKNRLKRDRAARRRLEDRLIPGLPVDADALETRVPMSRVGAVLEPLLRELTAVENPYFDAVCAQWNVLCPDVPARPGRMRDQHLFLYVRTSGQLFALHSRLPKIRRLLATIPGAPRRLSVHLEIHAESRP